MKPKHFVAVILFLIGGYMGYKYFLREIALSDIGGCSRAYFRAKHIQEHPSVGAKTEEEWCGEVSQDQNALLGMSMFLILSAIGVGVVNWGGLNKDPGRLSDG